MHIEVGMVVFSVPNLKHSRYANSATALLRRVDSAAELRWGLERREVALTSAMSARRPVRARGVVGFEGEKLAA